MSSTALQINLTVDIPNPNKTAKLNTVTNSLGNDITSSVLEFCNNNSLELNTQSDIEKAIEEFYEENKGNIALCP